MNLPSNDSPLTRRELRVSRTRRRRAFQAGAVLVALGIAGAGYGVINAEGGEQHQAALITQEAPIPDRLNPVSRSVDRLPLDDGIQRTFTATVDGDAVEVTTLARTLSEALADAGIEVGFLDDVSEPLNSEPTDVTITRVTESIETVEEKVPFTTTRTETNTLYKGTEQVQTKGQDGVRTATKRILRKDGKVVSEEILAEAVGSDPVDEVILVGTQQRPAPAPSTPAPSSPAPSAPAPSGGSPRAIAQELLGSFGWGQDQWGCLNSLWQRESNWNPSARNPSSGAYGIPQSLPASKMASAGADYLTNPETQIRWGLGYIKGRYGSPCGAWGHSERTGWY